MKEEKACNRSGAYIAPNATVVGAVSMGKDSSLWYQAVARGDHDSITIGEGSNIQDGCILHADAGFPVVIGDHVTVGHAAIIHGCEIGDGALIGMGSIEWSKDRKKCDHRCRRVGDTGNSDSGWYAGSWFSGKSQT